MDGGSPDGLSSSRSSNRQPIYSGENFTYRAGMQDLKSVELLEYFEQDVRPTFIVDLTAPGALKTPSLRPAFNNAALRSFKSLQDAILGRGEGETAKYAEFKVWVLGGSLFGSVHPQCLLYGGFQWTRSIVRKRWSIVSGSDFSCAAEYRRNSARESSKADGNHSQKADDLHDSSATEHSIPGLRRFIQPAAQQPQALLHGGAEPLSLNDWTAAITLPGLSDFAMFARNIDWSNTKLGPIHTWSHGLRWACNMLMVDPRPASLIWGPEHVMIYNERYIEIAGHRHPTFFGRPFKEIFGEISYFDQYFKTVEHSRRGLIEEDSLFFLQRDGYIEETYFSFSLIPIFENDTVSGLYNPVFDVTRRQVAERRMSTLIRVGEQTSTVPSLKDFWKQALTALKLNDHDLPFASLYSVSALEDVSDTASISSLSSASTCYLKQLVLEGSYGIPDGHPAAVPVVNLTQGVEGFTPHFRRAARAGKPIALRTEDGSLQEDVIRGIPPTTYGDPYQGVVICPIQPTVGAEKVLGFILVGLNPRRPYNEDYHLFFQLLRRLLATTMASAILIEEEIEKGRTMAEQAALDQARLQEQLDLRAKQIERTEMQFTHFADNCLIGISIFDPEGNILYANDIWYDVTQYPRETRTPLGWLDCFYVDEVVNAKHIWKNVVEEKHAVTFESRFKKPWKPPGSLDRTDIQSYTWILASVYPELESDGSVNSIVGCFMEISQQKYVEVMQRRRMDEAIEAKRQQESFIDMTSHEMRNPLSAIVHCADGIIDSLGKIPQRTTEQTQASIEALASSIDAAQTIILCANHQRRIIDDVLTLSKLDSDLLSVAPDNVNVVSVIQGVLRMFEGELKSADIQMHLNIEQSISELGVDWVYLDPSRMSQVFINLLTNAIKFTQLESKRYINVRLGASLERPSSGVCGVKYVKSNKSRPDLTLNLEWGNGPIVYIHCTVEDSGRGLSRSEMNHLFNRFSQATPRTHVQYGGSGLGLFISRELTELQGGEIGVASESGKGSTFAFYVKARKAPILNAINEPAVLGRTEKMQMSVIPSKRSRTLQTTSTAATVTTSQKYHILIVEDNLVNQKVLRKQLTNKGLNVEVVNHGEEALQYLQETQFWSGKEKTGKELTVVLMDLEMPVMDGLTCVKRIRELERQGKFSGHVPTIAVTANVRKEQIETALAAGMDDVVSKPFRIPELLAKIESLKVPQDQTASLS